MDIMKSLFNEDEIARRYYLRVQREALNKGIQQGMQQGVEKGLEQGEQNANLKVAMRLFARGSSEADVADILNLSISAVKQMRQQLQKEHN